MGRQRTINDAEFWRAPRIADRTQEDKATLLYLLTSPYSNIIGIYQIVPRIAAAEMGWTADQLLSILKRLGNHDLVLFEDATGFVWVKNWWDHNSAKMAVATTLRSKTFAQIDEIPPSWRNDFLKDFLRRIPPKDGNVGVANDCLRDLVATEMTTRGYTVSIPYPQAIGSRPANTNNNAISNSNTNTTPNIVMPVAYPNLEPALREQLQKIISQLPPLLQQDVVDEIAAKISAGTLRNPLALARHFATHPEKFALSEGHNVRLAREKRAVVQAELSNQEQQRAGETAKIEEQLATLSEHEFKAAYKSLPPKILQHLQNRREQLQMGAKHEQ